MSSTIGASRHKSTRATPGSFARHMIKYNHCIHKKHNQLYTCIYQIGFLAKAFSRSCPLSGFAVLLCKPIGACVNHQQFNTRL